MSIVVIPGAPEPELGDDDYAGLLAAVGGAHAPPQDQDDYRAVLRSFLAVMRKIEALPDYTPPALVPQPAAGGPDGADGRAYWVPRADENPLNAWSHRCAIRAADATAVHPHLRGRALAVKDNISVGGLPTTIGTSPWLLAADGRWACAAVDAVAVGRLLAAGAVVRGTSTCEAWCASPLSHTAHSGPVHNPRLRGHTAGGSSSGSAALVAAHGLSGEDGRLGPTAELAIGTDQAGSVRIPACYNGLYGLKPTFGLVPYTGAASMSPMIDHLGPLAASLEDVAAMLEAMAGADGLDPRMPPEAPLRGAVPPYSRLLETFRKDGPGGKRWRIGLLTEAFAVPGLTPVVRDTVLAAARAGFAAAGADVVDVSVPAHADGAAIWNAATRPSMAGWLLQGRCAGQLAFVPPHLAAPQPASWPPAPATFDRLHAGNPAAVNILLSQAAAQRLLPPGLEAKAHRLALGLRAAYDAALAGVDVLVTPCAPDVAGPLPADPAALPVHARLALAVGTTNNTSPFNVTGHPALSVPCGQAAHPAHPDVPLPIGMQIVGRRFADEQVLLAAALFEGGLKRVNSI